MTTTIIKNALVCINNELKPLDIKITNGIINQISEKITDENANALDCTGLKILPGIIETHTHGGMGYDMNSITEKTIDELSIFYAKHGVTGFYATLLTDCKENLIKQLKILAEACKRDLSGAKCLGIHMEGPFLSEAFKGAMPLDLLQKPSISDFNEYQHAAKGFVKIMTISPELDGSIDFVDSISNTGVICSIGHSAADYDTACNCIRHGAKCSTHTFNAMRPFHHREPGILGAAFDFDIYSEIICDGLHVHPANIRSLLKIKGFDKTIAITDSMSAAGMPDGNGYILGDNNEIVAKDGQAWIKGTETRAGSTLTSDNAVKNMCEFTCKPIEEIIQLFSENQAKMLDIFTKKGNIAKGKYADFSVWDDKNNLKFTIVEGKVI